jgi:ABC-type cobalamin/Fe3+-siderophores transport system ATPase subunit
MTMQTEQVNTLLKTIEESCKQILIHQRIASVCQVERENIELHEKLIQLMTEIKDEALQVKVPCNYLTQFQSDISQAVCFFPYFSEGNPAFLDHVDDDTKIVYKRDIERNSQSLKAMIEQISFGLDFFRKIGFFKNNIVAIGANGCGKTSLANDLKRHLSQNGVVISAQKVLIIPTFSGISNIQATASKLQASQIADKTYKTTYSTENGGNAFHIVNQMAGEFYALLDNLLAERNTARNKFCDDIKNGKQVEDVPTTKLDQAIDIWNSLLPHRNISCSDGINITLTPRSRQQPHAVYQPYAAYQMSDGEKVILFFISQVLQAPSSGFIVIDEPEMYLHKTIVNKLWDTLEAERRDCIFIYLTHDLDFAASRVGTKKIWIKSFTFPNQWEIEVIPENDIPEQLLMELLGSRKDILFCEGKNTSLDLQVFNLLFSGFSIYPVNSCFDVIHYTKAFNKIPNMNVRAHGIIDSDHHSAKRLLSLEEDCVYSFSMSEIENLFFDEAFLTIVAAQLLKDQSIVELIKADVMEQFRQDLELQIAHYLSTKIHYYFQDSHVSKGNDLNSVVSNLQAFTNEVKVNEWYDSRKTELEALIQRKDYPSILKIYNNKGLKAIAQKHLKTSEFVDLSLRMMTENKTTCEILKRHFPEQLQS